MLQGCRVVTRLDSEEPELQVLLGVLRILQGLFENRQRLRPLSTVGIRLGQCGQGRQVSMYVRCFRKGVRGLSELGSLHIEGA